MPERTGMILSGFIGKTEDFFLLLLSFTKSPWYLSCRSIMHFTRYSRKVDLVPKMVNNMGHLSGKKIGIMTFQISIILPIRMFQWRKLMRVGRMITLVLTV